MSSSLSSVAPLAERMRPQTLDDFAGHDIVIGQGTLLRGLIDSGSAGSLLLVGFVVVPRILYSIHLSFHTVGTPWLRYCKTVDQQHVSLISSLGKTSLARIIARMTKSAIKELSATSSGAADIRAVFEEAKNLLTLTGKRTVLFIGPFG